jgi:hypothetical protein
MKLDFGDETKRRGFAGDTEERIDNSEDFCNAVLFVA